MKIVTYIMVEVSAREARDTIPLIYQLQKIFTNAHIDIDSQIRMIVAQEGNERRGFFDLPSKDDTQGVEEIPGSLATWYRTEMLLSVLTSNALARADIFPRELALMSDSQILETNGIGAIGLTKIRGGFDFYFTY